MRIKKFELTILWDIFMVLVVMTNLCLILFDMTYLWLRPFYYKNFPKILQMYDKPILGIEGHRSTEKYLHYVDELRYLETIQDPESFLSEFEKSKNNFKITLESLDIQGDARLGQVQESLLSLLDGVNKPSQLNQRFFDAEEDLLDLLIHREKEPFYSRLDSLIKSFDLLSRVQTESGWLREKEEILSKMDYQIIHIVETNPFQESGQTDNMIEIQSFIKGRYDSVKSRSIDREYREILTKSLDGRKSFPSTSLAFTYFWRNPDNSMEDKFTIFDQNLRDNFGMNYYRHIGKNGKPVYKYLMLDAPFLIFFLIEFSVSWFIAIRRKRYLAWFLYPVYHWYDILGLIPIVEFRIFRLIRVYKIFLILKTSRIVPVGDDIISRTLRYYTNIIKEEISDMVTIQILTEAQEEIRTGASMQILTHALDVHRPEIKQVILKILKESASNQRLGELIEKLIASFLEKAQSDFRVLGIFPNSFKQTLSKEISQILYHTLSNSIVSMLNEGAVVVTIENLVDYVLDEFEATAQDEDVNQLNSGITIELLENVKKSVGRKKWLDTNI